MEMDKPEHDSENFSGGQVATRIRTKQEKVGNENPRLRDSGEYRAGDVEADDDNALNSNSQHGCETRQNRSANTEPGKAGLREEETFKSWLSARIMDGLNTAAGATLSTTGQLIAPPLHVTKTVILPSLLGLFVETLDAVTPQRLKDWFRILSSSIHHLVSVIKSTKGGKQFSSRFLDVAQDIALVASAPETRNILIDTMAFGVKAFDALNTEEMRILMDHFALLACRIVDVASSGKTKQLFHSLKGMIQDGVEMGSDPAATLAFAEVTAHLCYALEDIYLSLEPKDRHVRNMKNRETYLSPLEVSGLHNQPTVEQVILSCLGRLDRAGNDNVDLPQRGETKHLPNLKDRIETVDVDYLRKNLLVETKAAAFPSGISVDNNNSSDSERTSWHADDIEDFKDRGSYRPMAERRNFREEATIEAIAEPTIRKFYETLDVFLKKNRSESKDTVFTSSSYSSKGLSKEEGKQAEMLRAKVQKLQRRIKSTGQGRHIRVTAHIPSKRPRMPVVVSILAIALAIIWSAFGVYGVYVFIKSRLIESGNGACVTVPEQSEIVFRIVREVRHYNSDEKEAMYSTFTTEQELGDVTNFISSQLQIDSEN